MLIEGLEPLEKLRRKRPLGQLSSEELRGFPCLARERLVFLNRGEGSRKTHLVNFNPLDREDSMKAKEKEKVSKAREKIKARASSLSRAAAEGAVKGVLEALTPTEKAFAEEVAVRSQRARTQGKSKRAAYEEGIVDTLLHNLGLFL
jgi:hypothetical protein